MIRLSVAGLLGVVVLPGFWPCSPPLGQFPPLHWLWLLLLFSISLISSSSRKTIFFWMSWVFSPGRDRSSRRPLLSISRSMLVMSFGSGDQLTSSTAIWKAMTL